MRIGVPKEIKVLENRVGLTPASVREAVHHGHEVVVERNAGQGIGMDDEAYRRAGGSIGGRRRLIRAARVHRAQSRVVDDIRGHNTRCRSEDACHPLHAGAR